MHVDQMLQSGVHLQQQGRVDDARHCFLNAVREYPDHAAAWLHLGVLEAVTGKTQEALLHFARAVALAPENFQCHLNLGLAYANLGQLADAELCFLAAQRLNPHASDVALNLANIKLQQGAYQDALDLFDSLLRQNNNFPPAVLGMAGSFCKLSRYPEALATLEPLVRMHPEHLDVRELNGMIFQGLKKYERAVAEFEFVIQRQPNRFASLMNLGQVYLATQDFKRALVVLNQALSIDPKNPDILASLGVVHTKLKQYEEAFSHFRAAISERPSHYDAHNNLGIALAKLKRFDEALEAYQAAKRIQPTNPEAYKNEALVYGQIKEFELAEKGLSHAMMLAPEYDEIKFNRAMLRLSLNQFSLGWRDYAFRFYNAESRRKFLETPKPRWDGRDTDQRLLLWNEQGIGDELLYMAFLRAASVRATHITVRLDPRLIRLFERSFVGIKFISDGDLVDPASFDVQLPFGDLPGLFINEIDDFASVVSQAPYLQADNNRVHEIRDAFCGTHDKVGLSWSSAGKHYEERILPLESLAKMLTLNGDVDLFDLQYLDSKEDKVCLFKSTGIAIIKFDSIDSYNDLDGLAAVIDAMDYVVTCSNTTAHLAGALGKETYVLVPFSRGKKWYWNNLIHGKCVWYPNVTVIEQKEPGAWGGVLDRLAESLQMRTYLKERVNE